MKVARDVYRAICLSKSVAQQPEQICGQNNFKLSDRQSGDFFYFSGAEIPAGRIPVQ